MLALAKDIALFEKIDDKDLMNNFIYAACSVLRLVGSRREEVIFHVLDIIEDLRIVSLTPVIDDSGDVRESAVQGIDSLLPLPPTEGKEQTSGILIFTKLPFLSIFTDECVLRSRDGYSS